MGENGDVRAAIKEQESEVARALFFGKFQSTFDEKSMSSLGFPLVYDTRKEEFPRLPPVKLKSGENPLSIYCEEKFERDGSGPRLINDEEALLIGSYLDVPIEQEICSSGGKKSAGGNWLSVSQGIAEDASDLVSGFATIGDGLSESVDYRNEYWDSDEYEDDDDIGYVRQPIEDETWFLAHEIDYPNDHEKGTTRESPDHHGRDATKDEDDQSYAEEASYISGEQCLQSKDAEPISSENDRRLTVLEIYPASKKNDLISPYDGQLMDEEVLNSMRDEPVWQGFVAQTNELKVNAHRKSHLDDVCLKDDQHDSVRSIGVGINSDAADFGSEVRESLAGGTSEGDFEYSRDHDGVASRFKQLYSESDKKHIDGSNKNNSQKASKNDGPGGSFHVKAQTDGCNCMNAEGNSEGDFEYSRDHDGVASGFKQLYSGEAAPDPRSCKFMNVEDISGSCLMDIDKSRVKTGEDIILFGNKNASWSGNTSKGNHMGSTRLRTEDVVDTTSQNWKEYSVKTLFRSHSRGFASTSCNLVNIILLSFCKVVSAETITKEPVCETQAVYATCYEQLMIYFGVTVVIAGLLIFIWRFCMAVNQVSVPNLTAENKKKKKKPKKDKTKKNDNGGEKKGFGDVFVKVLDKHNLPAKDNVDVQEEVLPEASDEEELLSEARVYEARVYAGVYNQRDVALKVYPATDLHFELMVNELAKTYKTDYQANIIHCYGIQQCKGSDSFCLLLQPWECTLGELVEFFWGSKEKKKTLSVKQKEFFKGYGRKDFWEPSNYPTPNHPTPLLIELLKGIIEGVGQLHCHKIVHRDLHPENVFITSDGKKITARIGGMSRSMYLTDGENLTTSDGEEVITLKIDPANNMWQPPEVVDRTNFSICCENDMYSVGCMLVYAIAHKGLPDVKQAAVDLVEFVPEAHHLIQKLMHNSRGQRLKAGKACGHPFFWEKEKRMHFFEVASNRFDRASKQNLQLAVAHSLSCTLKGRANVSDWELYLEADFKTHIKKQSAKYNTKSFFDLVRLIRNSSQHFRELPPVLNIKSQTEVWEYFAEKFPALLIEVYKVVKKHVKGNNHDKDVTFGTFFKE